MTRVFVYEHLTATAAAIGPDASLFREGRAMRDAVVADLNEIPGLTVVPFPDGGGVSHFDDALRTCDISLVIAPETGGVLESLVRRVEDVGVRLLGPSAEAVRQTADKLSLARRWAAAGVPTPRTESAVDWPADRVPCVLKLRDGAGSIQTFFCANGESFLRNSKKLPLAEAVACDYVPGKAVSVSFLIGPAEVMALPPALQFVSPDRDFAYEGGQLPIPTQLADRAERLGRRAIACVPGLRGYVGVDLVLGEDPNGHSDFAIEINPRLTTSYVGLREYLAGNLAKALLEICEGTRPELPLGSARRIRFYPDGTVETQEEKEFPEFP